MGRVKDVTKPKATKPKATQGVASGINNPVLAQADPAVLSDAMSLKPDTSERARQLQMGQNQ